MKSLLHCKVGYIRIKIDVVEEDRMREYHKIKSIYERDPKTKN